MAREYGLRFPSRIRYLRCMLNDAQRDGLVSQNVFAALRIAKPRRERYFPSTEKVEDLIRAAQEPLRGRIRFSAYTGLRLGEVLAVRRCDLDAGKRVQVQWQINAEGQRVPPKGKVKDRLALMPTEAWQGLPLGERLAHRKDRFWPLTRAEHNKEWNALRKALKLPENFVWHSLRHHAATWFLNQGASDEDVAIQLGHSDGGAMVREVYGHRDRGKALDRLEELVS
jgi:integrase